MKKIKVFLFGGENTGWALDTDLALTKKSLEPIGDLELVTDIKQADVIHSVWEEPLLKLDGYLLDGKRIICHACNDVFRLYEKPTMMRACNLVGTWVAQANKLKRDFDKLNIPSVHIPYSVDTEIFTPRSEAVEEQMSLRRKFSVPPESFVISNFMRDSDGTDLTSPKEQKSPELFLQLIIGLAKYHSDVHVLLAGPRRHWLRARLKEHKINVTFVGRMTDQDDNGINISDAETINKLYHLSDLHLISSKWEGGPRSILEAVATKTPVFSTPVGIAEDILPQENIYHDYEEGLNALLNNFKNTHSECNSEKLYNKICQSYTPAANQTRFARLYQNNLDIPIFHNDPKKKCLLKPVNLFRRFATKISNVIPCSLSIAKKPITISIWHEFHKPPYGGGNQFMLALSAALKRRGVSVFVNNMSRKVDVHLCNSAWFDTKLFERKSKEYPVRMIHRIDGPVTLYRGQGCNDDDRIFELNNKFASSTIFQSAFCYRESIKLGYKAINPIVISNAADPDIFYPSKRIDAISGRKVRIISSAWSDNPRKGGALYAWLDDNLDWNRYEYTFVGRIKRQLKNIRHIDAVDSGELAQLLRNHDIFLSASEHEPCSNALIEALMCGLPAVYRNDGGNPEIVGYGGVPFLDKDDVLKALERLTKNYDSFRTLIHLKSIDVIAERYLEVAQDLLKHEC